MVTRDNNMRFDCVLVYMIILMAVCVQRKGGKEGSPMFRQNQLRKQQRVNESPAQSHQPGGHKKHISFDRNAPKVTVVKAPKKQDHPDLWFQESQKVVAKPLQFDIEGNSKISIDIGKSVQITTLACSPCEEELRDVAKRQRTEKGGKPVGSLKRVGLLICDNNLGLFQDSMEERLNDLLDEQEAAKGNPLRQRQQNKHAEKWFCVGSAPVNGIAVVDVMLPRGSYLLKCDGPYSISVFGQAADIVRHLE